MKSWTRLTTIVTIAASAVVVALSPASALLSAPPPPDGGHTAADVLPARDLVPATPRPPASLESAYTPITPCRIVDTRIVGGPMANGAIRTYNVGGSDGFTTQGGRNGGCGIPVGSTAIAATITAVSPTGAGVIRAWPSLSNEPNATILNYPKGISIGTGSVVSIQPSIAAALKVKNYSGPTNVVIDVSGYYAQQLEGMIAPDGTVYSGTGRLVSATKLADGYFQVTWDSDVSNCTPMASLNDRTAGDSYASARAFSGSNVFVRTWKLDPTTHLEVPTNDYFYVTVTC